MNTRKFVRSTGSVRRMFVLLMVLLLVVTQVTDPARGMRREDPTETDPIGVGNDPPPYIPPTQGFSWSMEKRFGLDQNGDGMIDYHWDRVSMTYDPAYVYPTVWKITFNGCQTGEDYSNPTNPANYYVWKLGGTNLTTRSCKPTLTFYDKEPHTMSLTVTMVSEDILLTFPEQQIQVKDYFIVSIGDSYASGQGNPDIEQVVDPGFAGFGWNMISPAQWQDERCMRSAKAGPALAALALEASDPHSSVTFISFACTGATINSPSYDLQFSTEEGPHWDFRGSGILGIYRGENTNVPYGDYDHYIKPQIQQVQEALVAPEGQTARQIDALLISGGGNDMKFPALITQCVLFTNCWVNNYARIQENPTTDTEWYDLADIVVRGVGEWQGANPPQYTVPGNYALMGAAINNLNPKPAHVYVTQYPDPTINDRGVSNEANETYQHHCRMLDDILWPNPVNVMTDQEALFASHFTQIKLNDTIRIALANLASTYTEIDWQFVDGLSIFDVDPDPAVAGKPGLFAGGPTGGAGHGYCASDNWIRRADESELTQGPVNMRKDTLGTMHPNYSGQQAIKARLLRYMLPDLTGQSSGQPPSFSFSYSSGGLNSLSGLNSWYLRSCDSSNNCQPKVVGQAVATSTTNLNGASISVNDEDGCAVPGVSCTISLSPDQKQVTYAVEISATGIYRFQFNAQDANGQAAFLQKEIKVDLEDPVLATPIGPFEVLEGTFVVVSASVATNSEGVPLNDDVLVNYDWDLDSEDNYDFEIEDEQPAFSAADIDGPAIVPIRVKVTDRAGRTATAQSEVHVLHDGPVVSINGAPATSPEGTAIHLTSSVNSTLAAPPFTYAWQVMKNGAVYVTGASAAFSFIPNDNGSYEVSLAVTKDGGSVGTASQTIDVTNVAPTAAFTGAPASVLEGTAIQLAGSANDPGTADTITSYDWLVKKDGVTYAFSTGANSGFTPWDNGSYEVSLSVTDDDGGVGMASQTIAVTNVAPTAAFTGAPASTHEGTAISLTGSVTDPGIFDTFTYAWTVKQDGSSYTSGSGANFSFTPDENGSYEVTLQVTDNDGGVGSAASQTISVVNVAPALSNVQVTPGTVNEGSAVTLSGDIADPSPTDTFTLTVNWGDGSQAETANLAAGTKTFSLTHTYADDNPTGTASDTNSLSLSLQDDDGGTGAGSASVVVNNLALSLIISAPESGALYAVNASINLSAALTDPSTFDTLNCSVNWGDGATTTGTLAAGVCTASHAYPAPGVYTIQMTGTDDDTGSDMEQVMVVVYDPSAGFVTGGGWINSPAGAYKPDANLSGRATFGFVSKYKKGSTLPTGNTAFRFEAGGFEFDSTAYEWLVVNQAGTNAQFKGSGLINGAPDDNGNLYKFMVWAGDGTGTNSADTFRIRIWWEDADGGEHDVYDNGTAQAIGGGSIVVHTSK